MTVLGVDMVAAARLARSGVSRTYGLDDVDAAVGPLLDAGLVAFTGDGTDRYRLTPAGVAGARILLSMVALDLESTASSANPHDADILADLSVSVVGGMQALGCITVAP